MQAFELRCRIFRASTCPIRRRIFSDNNSKMLRSRLVAFGRTVNYQFEERAEQIQAHQQDDCTLQKLLLWDVILYRIQLANREL